MDTIKKLSNQRNYNPRLALNINLTAIGIFIFTFVFSTLKSFLFYRSIYLLLLLIALVFLLFSSFVINKKGIVISSIDIMWVLFLMLFVLNIAYNNIITSKTIIDILFYTSCVFFLIFAKVNIRHYNQSLKLIKLLAVIYACSAIFQYLYTDIYLSHVLPLFSTGVQPTILQLLSNNSYSGFTNQTAHIAGYIVNGIGIIIFSNWKKKLSRLVLPTVFLFLLVTGLLLTAKRAHLIFMIISIIITLIFSINNKAFFKKVIKITMALFTVLFLAFLLFTTVKFSEDSPIITFVNELETTIKGIVTGKDVYSGRIILYSNSLELFKEKPIIGIGWREFKKHSLGLINSDVGSHPHNIYLQLLTEFGIIGFILFIIPVIYLYYKTYRMLRILSSQNDSLQKWKFSIQFSFYSQTFFILYGLTGNLLTDHNFLLMYFFACSISLSALLKLKSKV